MNNNVIIISAVFPPEPLVTAFLSYDLANNLSKDINVTVLSPNPSRPFGYELSLTSYANNNFRHTILNSYTHPKSEFIGRFRESYSFGRACAKYIKTNHKDIDVIYMNTWPIFGQYLALKEAKKNKIPIIVHIQDIYPEAFTQKLPVILKGLINLFLFPLDRYITSNSTSIVTISQGMKNKLIATRKIHSSKIEVIYNWQDESKFSSEVVNTSSEAITHFMFLGSLGPVANIDNLVSAFALLNQEEIQLTIAGEGSEKAYLKDMVKDLSVKNIKFISAPSSEVGKIQATADILILSLRKGAARLALPSKLTAYMLSGKPIIASVDYDSDTANVIREASCGWIIEPENPQALAAKIIEVIKFQPTLLQKMGLAGREYAEKHFTKHVNLNKLASIIKKTLDED